MADPTFPDIGYYDLPPGKLAAVVTYLEMTGRPEHRPVPERHDLRLRPAPEMRIEAYRSLFRRVGLDWLWESRLLLSDAELEAILGAPGTEVFVLRRGEEDIGLLELDRNDPADIELVYFGLVPEAVGSGAGRWLMDRAIALAWDDPRTRRFWVHTCTQDSPQAIPFYIRSGFRPYRYAVEILDDPRLSGVLPRDAAPHLPLIG